LSFFKCIKTIPVLFYEDGKISFDLKVKKKRTEHMGNIRPIGVERDL